MVIESLFALVASSAIEPRPGRCLLQVEGQSYIDGECTVQFEPGGYVQILKGNNTDSVVAYIGPKIDGRASIEHTDANGTQRININFGKMQKNGNCWKNDRARLCGWIIE